MKKENVVNVLRCTVIAVVLFFVSQNAFSAELPKFFGIYVLQGGKYVEVVRAT